MESADSGNQISIVLVSELSRIRQLLIQLESQILKQPSTATATEAEAEAELSKSIVSQLLSSTEKSIFLAKSCGSSNLNLQLQGEPASSPRSASASPSPRSDMSELAFKCHDQDDNSNKRETCKKRKTLPRWRSQVRVGSMSMSMAGVEGPLDDGHSWRKYGQKDILGAKHPRGYYRCTYRNSQGCLATKQVQRTDEDPAVFDVVYQGTHTCTNKSNPRSGSNIISSGSNSNNKIVNNQTVGSNHDEDYLNSLKATLTVKTEGLGPSSIGQEEAPVCNSISFSFPSTPMGNGHVASTADNNFPSGSFLPSFANSPATSESNYFSGVGVGLGGLGGFGKVDSDLTEVISVLSAATSTTNSPMGGVSVDFGFDGLDFEIDIDPCSFLS
ncbi:WRKY family transcription factor [Rhynchospora pubera]|uniref:WRKY family transcription factor n=1 Tax=Rhynchospora pubera TaxID=906938 RepID=A0AAV8GV05_9POAL|nr:WRKY family transcription factor [Rhynchospora pubera]